MNDDGRPEERREGLPLEEVERLVEMVRDSGVGEIQIRQGGLKITVRAMPAASAPPVPQPAAIAQSTPEPERLEEAAPAAGEVPGGLHAVRSPVVGTFYRAPAPGEEVYVEVGDRVKAGQTLCIIEAMKLMNEIPADIPGEVVEVLVENAGGVEYDQPLFYLRPEG